MMRHEDALICDFAETYHVYDFKRLPACTAASLASGLRDDSRSKMLMNGQSVSTETMMLAAMVDSLNLLVWSKTKDAEKGANRPKSVLEQLMPQKEKASAFQTGKDFEEARDQILRKIAERGHHGN